jgi:glycosyltransferase involved in cell wall biosynthesis
MAAEQAAKNILSVSVMIFTLDEEIHLPSCLASLSWCDDIIIVDSFSSDTTEEICRNNRVRFFKNKFEGFGKQRNWAIDNTNPKHPWILVLDADERVTPELVEEMTRVIPGVPDTVGAFRLKRRFYMWGRWLRYSSLYPTWIVRLIHKDRVRYVNRGHAETQEVQGEIREFKSDLIDENLKGIDEWIARQNRYSTKDAEYELSQEASPLKIADLGSRDPLIRRAAIKRLAMRMPARPFWYFFYSYFFKLGFLDGRNGLMFCVMKTMYQRMIIIKKYDIKKRSKVA